MSLSLAQLRYQDASVDRGSLVVPLDSPEEVCVVVEVLRDPNQLWSYSLISRRGVGLVLDRNEFLVIDEEMARRLMDGKSSEPSKPKPTIAEPGVNPKPPARSRRPKPSTKS